MADKPESTRYFRQPGDTWSVRLIARPSLFRADPKANGDSGILIDAATVLAEASAAMWLLTQYGGVGAKGRKGFGSLADVTVAGLADLASVKQQATRLRGLCRLGERAGPSPRIATLERMEVVPVKLGGTNTWYAINAIGGCYQDAVKRPELEFAKKLLGLPRKGVRDAMPRLASAMHLHLCRPSGSGLVARVATFDLPGINPKAAQFLSALRDRLADCLEASAKNQRYGHNNLYPPRSEPVDARLASLAPAQETVATDPTPRVGGTVKAVLLEEKTKNNGWRARDQASGQVRSIQNSHVVPDNKIPGEIVILGVPNNTEFKWPVPPPPPRPTQPTRRR